MKHSATISIVCNITRQTILQLDEITVLDLPKVLAAKRSKVYIAEVCTKRMYPKNHIETTTSSVCHLRIIEKRYMHIVGFWHSVSYKKYRGSCAIKKNDL